MRSEDKGLGTDLSKGTRLSGSHLRRPSNRILVCGGRNYSEKAVVFAILDQMQRDAQHDCMVVIQGGATGADALAREWCQSRFVRFEHYPAKWSEHGKAAGPIRNTRMLADGRPDIVVAFPGGTGTADMVRKAEAVGVPVLRPAGGVKLPETPDAASVDSQDTAPAPPLGSPLILLEKQKAEIGRDAS